MPARTVGAMDPLRRRLLLETAAAEFASAGYEHASLNRVIGACGMSKSSFYHYFTDKAALFDEVVTEAAQALGQALGTPDPQALEGEHFWDEVARLLGRLLKVGEQDAWYVSLGRMFYLSDAPPGRDGALGRIVEAMRAWLEAALAAGRRSGAVRADLPEPLQAELAVAVLQAMDRWSLRHWHEVPTADRERLAAGQLEVLHRLLAA